MSRRGSSNYNYDYDDDDNEEVLPANLDPTVAALLQKDPAKDSTMTTSSVRLVIAQMKLQQSRVRGNSDYAAKVMDDAIQEGARDREAWTLMDNRIRELEQHIATTAAAATETVAANSQEASNEEINAEDDTAESSDQKDDGPSSTHDPTLEKKVQEVTDRANTMESILVQCLKEELDHVQVEQVSIMKREEQLRARIRSLQIALQALPPEQEPSSKENNNKAIEKEDDKDGDVENTEDKTDDIPDPSTNTTSPIQATTRQDLQNAMKYIHEQQSTLLKTQCTICHEHTATRAVIPCGHLCLCDECTTRIVTPTNPPLVSGRQQEAPHQPQCPLCRGHLLSTLHIYTAK